MFKKISKIRNKFLIFIVPLFLLFLIFFYFGNEYFGLALIEREINKNTRDAEQEFKSFIEQDTRKIKVALEIFSQNSQYKEVFLSGDRDRLFDISKPLFDEIKEKYKITHFYYHNLDGTNFLRVHNRDINGDVINRTTFKESEKTGLISSGIELGKTAFALRVVAPYYYNDQLIGYVEFGQEIDHIISQLQTEYDNDFFVVVDKKYVSKEDWTSVREVKNLYNNWDDFQEKLIIDGTTELKSESDLFDSHCFEKGDDNFGLNIFSNGLLQLKERAVFCRNFQLVDASDQTVGSIVVLSNVKDLITFTNKLTLLAYIIIILSLFLTIILFLFLISLFIVKPLNKIHEITKKVESGNFDYRVGMRDRFDEIGELGDAFDSMIVGIKKSRAQVDEKVEMQVKEINQKAEFMEKQKKAILNILEDVDREKNETEKEKQKIDAILHSIGDAVFVVDRNFRIIMFNKIAAEISGFSQKEVINKNYKEVLKFVFEEKDELNVEFIKEAMETGEIKEMVEHTVLVTKDGRRVPVADSAAPLKDKAGNINGCVVVFRDVTKEREIDKAKTEFVSLASHQLRTPLSSINWYCEMLMSGDGGELNEDQKDFLGEIYKGNQRMVDLVNALLNVSRIELGTLAIDPKEIDFNEIAKSVSKELNPQIEERKIDLKMKLDKNIPKIKADLNLSRIIFQNLLSNAVKYTPEKGKIEIETKKDDKNIILKVSDTGYGIPKKQQDKIFTKLFRADNVQEKDAEGTGLGLYIIKSIIENAGGKIWFESEENKGTTFFVEFPLSGMEKKKGSKSLSQIK